MNQALSNIKYVGGMSDDNRLQSEEEKKSSEDLRRGPRPLRAGGNTGRDVEPMLGVAGRAVSRLMCNSDMCPN